MGQTRYLSKQNEPMAEAFGIKLLGALGIPYILYGILGWADPVTNWISRIAGLIMFVIWAWFKVDRWRHEAWKRKQERDESKKK